MAAEAFGAKGIEVSGADADSAANAIREAQAALKAGQAVLINAHIGKTNFREGSLSV
jgi:hypothetical protein